MNRAGNMMLHLACVFDVFFIKVSLAEEGPLTWTRDFNNAGRVYALVVDPANQSVLYSAGPDSGIYKTTNAGASWFASNNGLTYRAIQALAISPSDPNVLYAGTDQFGGQHKGVYVTTDGGLHWTLTSGSMADSGVQGLAVHPTNPRIVYAALFDNYSPTNGLYKTTDGGTSWVADTSGIGNGRRFLCVAVNPLNGNTIYAGTSFVPLTAASKIYKSVNGGIRWTETSNGLPATGNQDPVREISISTADTSMVLAALFHNDSSGGPFVTTNGGASWVRKYHGLPEANSVMLRSCLIVPGSSSEFFVGLDRVGNTNIGVWRTMDAGETWADFNGGAMSPTYTIRALAFRTQGDSTLYAGAANTADSSGRGVFEYSWSKPVSVAGHEHAVPADYSLLRSYPNPFNPTTTISFSIPHSGYTTLKIFNTLGQEITTLVSDNLPPGAHSARWNATNVPSGVYFYRLQAGTFTETKKLLLLR